jgi:hypothetical protein
MSWVWDTSPAAGNDLLLLLAIADFADDEGEAFPSVETLARKTRMSRSTVFRTQKNCIGKRWLEISQHGTGRSTSRYRILMDGPSGTRLTPQGSQDDTTTSLNLTPQGFQNDTPGVSDRPPRGVTADTQNHQGTEEQEDSLRSSSAPRKRGSTTAAKRGTRIPEDFALTDAMREWGRENAPHVDGERETQKFINHFSSVPGSKGVKLNWERTWHNWILSAADRFQPPPTTSGAFAPTANGPYPPRPSTTDQRVGAALDLAAKYRAMEQTGQLPDLFGTNRPEITT